MRVTGVIEYQEIGSGVWALVTEEGITYELKDTPPPLQSPQLKVQLEGEVRDDVMTLAMIGPVLEVYSFELLE